MMSMLRLLDPRGGVGGLSRSGPQLRGHAAASQRFGAGGIGIAAFGTAVSAAGSSVLLDATS